MPSPLHISKHSARRMVQQLHHHVAEQRQTVMDCRNKAEALTAAGIAQASLEGNTARPPPLCFVEVATEKDIKQNFIPNGPLSGIAIAVSDALDVQEFHTRSGLDTPMFHHVARKEFPLISWLRRQGAQFVGKMSCRTPLALSEGCVFGKEKPASVALETHACHYAISCSLTGPSSISCAVHHDIVGFKPTSQTFGTFTERFELTMPSMTLGLAARRVDDLMYLWQVYTASIDPVAYMDKATVKPHTSPDQQDSAEAATAAEKEEQQKKGEEGSKESGSRRTTEKEAGDVTVTGMCVAPDDVELAAMDKAAASSSPSSKKALSNTTDDEHGEAAAPVPSIRNWWGGKTVLEAEHPDDTPRYARPDILDHNPYNYTVKDRRGQMADIDVGWRDYNADSSLADGFERPPRAGVLRRLLGRDGATKSGAYTTPQVELAVGYPAEWIEQYCKLKYKSPREFHQRLTDAVYMHSALHKNQKMELVPLAFDFNLEDVLEATTTIAQYELARAFERLFRPAAAKEGGGSGESGSAPGAGADPGLDDVKVAVPPSTAERDESLTPEEEEERRRDAAAAARMMQRRAHTTPKPIPLDAHRPAAPNRPNTFLALSGVLEELPPEIVETIHAGESLTVRDYNRALRIRDDVVRATEEQFLDVDVFVVPLLSDPGETGNVRSICMTLPFHLAGNPILSVQVDKDTPVALVGELGRDAALMEDAFCFLQFVRGASPRWLRQRMFWDSSFKASKEN